MQHAAFKCCWDNISIATIRLQTHKQISVVTCAAVHAPNTKSAAAEVLKPRYFKMSMLKNVHVFFSNVPEKHHQMSLTSMILSCLCSIIRTYWRLIFFIRMLEFEKYHNCGLWFIKWTHSCHKHHEIYQKYNLWFVARVISP
jgi:hypothetical protein